MLLYFYTKSQLNVPYLLALVYSPSISTAIILYHSLHGTICLLNCQFRVRQFKEEGNSLQTESAARSVEGKDVKKWPCH